MHAFVLLCINPHMIFEVPSFTNSKDMIGAKCKKTGDPNHAHYCLTGSLSSQGTWYSTNVQNLSTLVSAVLAVWLRASTLKMGRVTLTTPLLRVVCNPYARIWYSLYLCAKSDDSIALADPEISLGAPRFTVDHVTWPCPFQGWFTILGTDHP